MANEQTEIERLRMELERAYRALFGFWNATQKGQVLGEAAQSYHAPTIAAACRSVNDGSLDGSEYFIGKPVSVLHDALRGGNHG